MYVSGDSSYHYGGGGEMSDLSTAIHGHTREWLCVVVISIKSSSSSSLQQSLSNSAACIVEAALRRYRCIHN